MSHGRYVFCVFTELNLSKVTRIAVENKRKGKKNKRRHKGIFISSEALKNKAHCNSRALSYKSAYTKTTYVQLQIVIGICR